MVGAGEEHRAELVEAELAVGLGVVDLLRVGRELEAGVVGLVVMQGERQLASEPVLVDVVEGAAKQWTELVDRSAEVAAGEQFLVQPASLEGADITVELITPIAAGEQGIGDRLGGKHARLHCGMAALDLGEVQGAQVAADQRAAVENHLGQRIQATFADGTGAVADALAAFEVLADHRMVLQPLELVERRKVRVGVGQVDDQANHHLVVFQVIQERPAGVVLAGDIERPASGVDHQALLVLGRIDFPDFLEADAVVLDVGVAVEVEALDQLLADVAAAAFGEQGVFGAQFHAGGVQTFFGIALTVDTQITGDDAADHAVIVEQRFLGGEARIDFHAQVLGLLGQPAAQVAQGNDVVAVVVHGLGHKQVRDLGRAAGILEHIDVVTLDLGVQRCAERLPVREQLVQRARFEHGAGKNVSTDFGAFFYDTNGQII